MFMTQTQMSAIYREQLLELKDKVPAESPEVMIRERYRGDNDREKREGGETSSLSLSSSSVFSYTHSSFPSFPLSLPFSVFFFFPLQSSTLLHHS